MKSFKIKMVNIFGLILLIMGFALPYLINMRIPVFLFFWVGGFLSLNKEKSARGEWGWARWAQIGILINIALNFIMITTYLLTGEGSISLATYWFSMLIYWLARPATVIGRQIFPYPETHYPDGSVSFQISYSQTLITEFLDMAIYALIVGLIGVYWEKRKQKGPSLKLS